MTLYEFLLALHIITAIVWLGAGFTLTLLILSADRHGEPSEKTKINSYSDWLAPRVFIPASFGTFLFGLFAALEGSWDFGSLWIIIGLAGWLISFGIGMGYFRTEGEALNALAGERGFDDPEIERRIDRMEAVARFELTILFLVVVDMAVKPTGDDGGVLLVGAAILAAAAVLAYRSLPGPARAA